MTSRSQDLTDTIIDTRASLPRRSRRAPTRSTARSRRPASRSSSTSICAAATSPPSSKQTGARITEAHRLARHQDHRHVPRERRARSPRSIAAARRRGEGNAGDAACRVRGDVQPFRRRARREDLARLLDARQPHHPPPRRIRPHGEDLRLRAGRAARRAHAGRLRVDAQLCRQLRQPRHLQGERSHHRARPAPDALPGSARQPHPDAHRGAVHPRHGHRQDARRRRQGSRHRARQAHHRRHHVDRHARGQASPTQSASASPTSTRRSAPARLQVANTLDSRIGQLEQLLSDAPKPSFANSNSHPRRQPICSTRA